MLIASAYAIRNTSSTRLNAARALGATRFQTFVYVVVLDGIPQLIVGFRTALAFAPIVVVATEMFSGTRYGLGDRIYEARLVYKVPEMYATLIVAGLVGYGLNKGFTLLCGRLVHWTGK
jgi:NitT/TauT family transport system permease protein